jgi:uncharacterized protein with PIN domain
MVIETSVIVAILFGEAEAEVFAELIEADPVRQVSVASALEASIWLKASSAPRAVVSSTLCFRPRASRSSQSPSSNWRQRAMRSVISAKGAIRRR